MMTLCANCGLDLDGHSETQTDVCLKMISLEWPALMKNIEKMDRQIEELVKINEMYDVQVKMLKAAVDDHNCYEKVQP